MKTHKNLYAQICTFENLLLAARKAATSKRFRAEVKHARRKITLPEIRQSLMSWLGHARQANTWSLRRVLMPRLAKFGSPLYLN
jgi:hypothetical protein